MIAAKLHQTFVGESAERMPYQCAADAKTLADGILGKLRTWLERLLDNGPSQRLINGAGAIPITGRLPRHVAAQICMKVLIPASHLLENLNRSLQRLLDSASRAPR